MAKKSMIQREIKRERLATKYAAKRADIKAKLKDLKVSEEEKDVLRLQLQKLPRDASPTRQMKRCRLTGRPHGYYRKFGLGRNKLREHTMRGDVPGLRKGSW